MASGSTIAASACQLFVLRLVSNGLVYFEPLSFTFFKLSLINDGFDVLLLMIDS